MRTAKLFTNGRSQAVRLPKEFRFAGTEVGIRQVGDAVVLFPLAGGWAALRAGLALFEPGFTLEREQPPLDERPDLLP